MKKYYNNKKILVTGASGFVGFNLIKKLSKLDAKVTAVTFSKKNSNKIKNVKYIKADLRVQKNCFQVCENVDIVFHCAANTSGANVIQNNPLEHLSPNLVINTNILKAAYESKVSKLIFISSNTVYPVKNYAVKEEDTNFNFFEKYHIVGWMKLFSEKMCEMYSTKIKNPMKTIVIRPANLYGPYDKFDKDKAKVIPSLIRKIVEKQNPLEIWGDGKDIKDFIYIDDFINGLLKVSILNKKFNIVNISSSKKISINKIAKILLKLNKMEKWKILHLNDQPSMIPFRLISNKKIKKITDWKINIEMTEGLKKTLRWYKNNIS